MDSKRLLVVMAERLYEDIRFVTQQNPTQIVDDDGVRAYNLLLNKTRKYYPYLEFLPDFPDWQGRTIKYKDALVVSGQLFAILKAISESGYEETGRSTAPKPAAAAVGAAPPAGSSSSSSHSASASASGSAYDSMRGGATSSVSASRNPAMVGSVVTAPSPTLQAPAPPQPIVPRKPVAPPPPPPPRSSPGSRGGVEDEHDPELYDSHPSARRREDGTIPFTME